MITPEQLTKIRLENYCSQEEMAIDLSITPEYLSRMENGKHPIPDKFIKKLKGKGLLKDEQEKEISPQFKKVLDILKLKPDLFYDIAEIIQAEPELLSYAIKAINGNMKALDMFNLLIKEMYKDK